VKNKIKEDGTRDRRKEGRRKERKLREEAILLLPLLFLLSVIESFSLSKFREV
jgi:hypothetical protein